MRATPPVPDRRRLRFRRWTRVARALVASAALALGLAGCAHSPSSSSLKTIEISDADQARELPLRGVMNGRDVGAGLEGTRGAIPADRFFRAATLSHATEDDKKVLLAHGVKLDIDLRTEWEVLRSRDALAEDPRFRYVHISLMGVGLYDALFYPSSRRGELYVDALVDHRREFRDVFQRLAAEKAGAVVFHCASGKDRTGIVAATLLSLAGVEREAIIHNYAISAHYLHPTAEKNAEIAAAIWESPPEAIEMYLDALEKYGGARAYLKSVGVSEDDLNALIVRLGQGEKK